jgi:hypothetical protein
MGATDAAVVAPSTAADVDERDARALLRRFGQFADEFGGCFSRRAQRAAATQYLSVSRGG